MCLSVDVEVPVTVSGNKALEENRIRVNGVPQPEDEAQSPLDDLNQFQQDLEHVRRQAFDQGWIMAYDYWATFVFDQQRPPMNYRYPIRHGLRGGAFSPLVGREYSAQSIANPSSLRSRRLRSWWSSKSKPTTASAESATPGFKFEPSSSAKRRSPRMDETCPPHEFLQPGDLPGLFGNNQGASDMSEANSSTTNNVWMRGGGGEKDNPRDDAATPSPSKATEESTVQRSTAPNYRVTIIPSARRLRGENTFGKRGQGETPPGGRMLTLDPPALNTLSAVPKMAKGMQEMSTPDLTAQGVSARGGCKET
ncbi:hypothetical protein BGZ57DRAFT_965137 [Hyaloscypha finlandica]|nr:hypothetical protein BGZ57DRAFT_965137 [Hyaloscypha finlandica]